jgi:hypothetical protein
MEGEMVFPLYMEGDYKGWRERERGAVPITIC